MKLDIRTVRRIDVCTVTLDGVIDVNTVPRLRKELLSLIQDGCTHLVVDLRKVSFIDSSGLGVLIGALRRTREKDGVVRIVCTSEDILKIFKISGLHKVFPIFSDPAKAAEF